jgi:hypothetical protein
MGRRTVRMVALWITITAAFTVSSCSRREPAPPAIEHRIGWLESNCLAIDNAMLEAGTPVTIVVFDDPQSIAEGRVLATTLSAEHCGALREERRAANTAKGMSFYRVASADARTIGLGIAIVGAVSRVGSGIDIDRDGKADQFTQCTTSEGISFAVWNAAPYQGMPLWSGYYYLGYDTERTCPA